MSVTKVVLFTFPFLAFIQAQLPDQFHISLSGIPNEMVIEYVTHKEEPSYCMYATDPSILIAPSTPEPQHIKEGVMLSTTIVVKLSKKLNF